MVRPYRLDRFSTASRITVRESFISDAWSQSRPVVVTGETLRVTVTYGSSGRLVFDAHPDGS